MVSNQIETRVGLPVESIYQGGTIGYIISSYNAVNRLDLLLREEKCLIGLCRWMPFPATGAFGGGRLFSLLIFNHLSPLFFRCFTSLVTTFQLSSSGQLSIFEKLTRTLLFVHIAISVIQVL